MILVTSLAQWCPTAPQVRHATGRTLFDMEKPLRKFIALAVDPENSWRFVYVEVTAFEESDAKVCARGQLANTKQDHWSIKKVFPTKEAA